MEKKFYQTPEFKRVSTEWEHLLKEEGLEAIDQSQNAGGLPIRRKEYNDPVWIETKAAYFQALEEQASQAQFDNEIDRIVMTMKAQGAHITEICRALLAIGMSRYRRTVRLIIRKYEHRWGIRNWKPEDLKYDWLKKQRTR